jgi:hypothetical protein
MRETVLSPSFELHFEAAYPLNNNIPHLLSVLLIEPVALHSGTDRAVGYPVHLPRQFSSSNVTSLISVQSFSQHYLTSISVVTTF